ncbi:hypothetical protein O7626_26135 [Micromonospora sp. WMMD1102]|uniref:hypothetical protein n=1 Tax=Micromonospora sp. WMMD1102 TaxID=3016105 RepID=UPI0024156AD9|nr:hypothetical protein [Micromonospora sp. WMMD1102]MDG4789361.1 hypothetical protein [Micromonospora sp. WMMD1102]
MAAVYTSTRGDHREENGMNDFTPQTADGKVLWHFTMSLDGFVAGATDEDEDEDEDTAVPQSLCGHQHEQA